MSTEQHEALRLADWQDRCAVSIENHKTAAMLRSSHALIVQMAEALEVCGRALEEIAMNGDDPEDAIDDGVISTLNTAFIAATQYLKGPKP